MSWNVFEELAPFLVRSVAVDAGDSHSSSKLKLLRIAQRLCSGAVHLSMVVAHIVEKTLDNFTCALLGHKKRRISLLGLLDPWNCPVSARQTTLYALASD